jgi:hypothetical protein
MVTHLLAMMSKTPGMESRKTVFAVVYAILLYGVEFVYNFCEATNEYSAYSTTYREPTKKPNLRSRSAIWGCIVLIVHGKSAICEWQAASEVVVGGLLVSSFLDMDMEVSDLEYDKLVLSSKLHGLKHLKYTVMNK